jgi:hypothetical protein
MSDSGETTVPSPEFLSQSRGPSIRGVVWVSVICSIIIVIMRVHTRIFLRRVFGIDDWFIVFAMVSKDLVSEKPSWRASAATTAVSSRFID